MKKLFAPILLFAAMFGVAWYLVKLRPEPKGREVVREKPFVEAVVVNKQSLRSSIRIHGIVKPRTQTTLLAEVAGIIEGVAPFLENGKHSITKNDSSASFRAGGFFRKGDLLLKIEDVDLQTSVAEANANLSRTKLQLIQEQELAKQAKIEWGERDWSKAPDLVKRIPQILKAEAETEAAEAKLRQAAHNLSRAQVRAPFEGRILETMADVGQRVGSGASSALAEVYALDSAEIHLSLSRSEMKFLGFSEGFRFQNEKEIKTEVLDQEGQAVYTGILERSEGVIDRQTRLSKLIARVDHCFPNPFRDSLESAAEPLRVGQFVNIRLLGEQVEVYVVPDSAFRSQDTILVIDPENGLRTRRVKTLHHRGKEVWITHGLKNGDRVCVTPVEIITEGMKVRIADQNVSLP
ncbi:efflux RND transporter periplasmic adaptor subunit [Verrucomicrobia bacterium]|nr:efflux RND transporter periplasmic adaptor subunit [Verrucomicrobiota bacterium]